MIDKKSIPSRRQGLWMILELILKPLNSFERSGIRRACFNAWTHKKLFLSSLIASLFASLSEGISLIALALAIDTVVAGKFRIPDFLDGFVHPGILEFVDGLDLSTVFIGLILIAILGQVIRSGLIFLGDACAVYLTAKVRIDLAEMTTRHTMELSYSAITAYPPGEIAGLVEQSRVGSALVGNIHRSLRATAMLIAYGFVAFSVSITGGAVVALGGVVLWKATNRIGRKLSRLATHEAKKEISAWRNTFEFLNLSRLLRVFGCTGFAEERINDARRKFIYAGTKGSILEIGVGPLVEIIVVVGVGAILIASLFVLENPAENIAELFVLLLLIVRAKPQIISLNGIRLKVLRLLPKAMRVEKYLVAGESHPPRSEGTPLGEFSQKIRFVDIGFNYPRSDQIALERVNFEIMANQTVAIVGRSGSGKSTIVNLLLGLYGPTRGHIEVDGKDLARLDLGTWRKQIGVVDQDVTLLNLSVKENIAFARPDISFEEITAAASAAGAEPFISKLEHGYDTILGDKGYRLSGGEKQRIALARALVSNPPILVLDEATSSLDGLSEKIIQTAIADMHGRRTVIMISHRFSTLASADWIIAVEHGRVIEQGPREELLKSKGLFSKLADQEVIGAPYQEE